MISIVQYLCPERHCVCAVAAPEEKADEAAVYLRVAFHGLVEQHALRRAGVPATERLASGKFWKEARRLIGIKKENTQ